MDSKNISRKAHSYIIEVILAIVFIFFLLGGSKWSPLFWAIFTVFTIWVVVMNVRRDAGLESEIAYDRWKLQVTFLMVIGLLVASMLNVSLWLFILGLVLGAFGVSNLRAYHTRNRLENDLEHKNVRNE